MNASKLNVFSIMLVLGGVLVFYTNMGGRIPLDLEEPENKILTVQAIADEINSSIARIENNEFGENGKKALALFLAKNINYLGVKLKAKTCNDLKAYVPRLPTGRYLTWLAPNGSVAYCKSSVEFIESVYEALNNRKPSKDGMVNWLRVYQEKGFVELVVDIANRDEFSDKNPSSNEKVKALFVALFDDEPASTGYVQWVDLLNQKGLPEFVRTLASTPESQIRNESLFDGIVGAVDKLKVRSGKLELKGWACQQKLREPLKIEIYAGGNKIEKQLVAEGFADQNRHNVEGQCQTGVSHSFFMKSRVALRPLSRAPLEAYGINPVTGLKVRIDGNLGKSFHVPDFRDDDDD